jgi:hypothetical protein
VISAPNFEAPTDTGSNNVHRGADTLHVPEKSYTKIARQLIAMARRRAHQVRGHWRMDWRNPGSHGGAWRLPSAPQTQT